MNEYVCPYCGIEALTTKAMTEHIAACSQRPAATGIAMGAPIYASPTGNDTTGNGTEGSPYKTLTKALAVANINQKTIFLLPGAYKEAAIVEWPSITGIKVIGLGDVTVSNGNAAAEVIHINPTYTASTFEATLKDINISADTQIGLALDNTHLTKKLIVYLEGVSAEMDTSGDSIDQVNPTADQAIRIYAKDCSFEGLIHLAVANAGARYRFEGCEFIGGITTTGAVAAEVALLNCIILTSGISIAAEQKLSTVACVYRTDADPAVYTNCANAFATY